MKSLAVLNKNVTKVAGTVGVKLAKHSPEILMSVGIVGVVTSAVLACRATLRCEQVLAEARMKFDMVKKAKEAVNVEYSDSDYKKDLTIVYVQTAADFIKLYGPAVVLGGLSIACLIGSHGILKQRNMALIAAYKTIEEGFNAYRARVREEYGEEKDYMLKHGLRAETVTEVEVDADGKSHKVKKTKFVADPNSNSVYARFFDEACFEWTKTPEYNFMFLRAQQNYFNDMLKARGHVFLNEVYDALGIPRTKAGAVVGWVIGDGDNFVDFAIFDGERPKSREFVNGYERSILLDFNVDGVIYDLI